MSFARSPRIRAVVRHRGCLLPGLLLGAMSVAHAAAPTALTVNTLSDSSGLDCIVTCSLRGAIANIALGGTIDFAQALLPGIVTLGAGPLVLTKSMLIQGPGAAQLTINADGLSRVLVIGDGVSDVTVNIVGVSLRDGRESGGNGGDGASGSGLGGQTGGSIAGGCIFVASGSLILDEVAIRDCVAESGTGGSGGTGTAGSGLSAGGPGGTGGDGGSAFGGGIIVNGVGANLTLRNSSLTNAQALGGAAGAGGDGGSGFFHGPGGKGGSGGGATGGAILFFGGSLSIYNSTIAGSVAIATDGGNGGNGDNTFIGSPGGTGANGGSAEGGLLDIQFAGATHLEFATLANGNAAPGAGGNGGAGMVGGSAGQPGLGHGAAFSSARSASVLSTVIVGTGASPLCASSYISAFGANLDQDSSCQGFTLHGTFAQLFRPLDPNMPRPAYMPLYHSAVIDAATTCNDLSVQAVIADQHGTPRPQGSACDIGAFEADYIFVSGFD